MHHLPNLRLVNCIHRNNKKEQKKLGLKNKLVLSVKGSGQGTSNIEKEKNLINLENFLTI